MENLDFITQIKSYTVIEKIAEDHSGDEKCKLEKDGKFLCKSVCICRRL